MASALTARHPAAVAAFVTRYQHCAPALPLDVADAPAAERATTSAMERFGLPDAR